MLHALLSGKLDPADAEPQRLEDALTSTVFGTIVMVNAWGVLDRWLGLNAETATQRSRSAFDCWFWPSLTNAVPDVVLRIGTTLVVVEAKFRSSRNDLETEEQQDEAAADQIVRQHRAVSPPHEARKPYPQELEEAVRTCRLVQAFVVDGRRMRTANREYIESKSRLPSNACLKLITWQALYRLLLEQPIGEHRWAKDLRAYLAASGLATFRDIRLGLAPPQHSTPLTRWSPFGNRRTAAGIIPTVATLAVSVTAIAQLGRWKGPIDMPGSTRRRGVPR